MSILLLVPAAAAWASGTSPEGDRSAKGRVARKVHFTDAIPGFVVAFIALVVLRSLGDRAFADSAAAHDGWLAVISASRASSEALMVLGMTAIGLRVSLGDVRQLGWRPVLVALMAAIAAALCSLGLTWPVAN